MNRRIIIANAFAVMMLLPFAGPALGSHITQLKVCGDPDNLPFSNKKSEGFENKIAEVIARELRTELIYFWWPHQRGLVRRALRPGLCDVMISIPQGWDQVLWTKPYYRSAYVLIYPKNRGFQIRSLDDPILKQLKIGVYINTPPAEALANRDIRANVVGYSLFDSGQTERSDKIIRDLIAGEIDVVLDWGPMAGYAVKQLNGSSPLEVVLLQGAEPGIPFTFEFSMGVKEGNKELKAELEEAISKRHAEIRKILEDYGVPLLPLLAREQFSKTEEKPGEIFYRRFDRDDPLPSY
ncbi:ABC transporter substrate-binding protein [Candidatus Methylomirabilis lanthanidiphila]|uniref:ABC transporter substrate-binding protein n=1 Tax=Candidatus Methylomirabilis lanthanidiphila TaxID=2211376 RepID=A0A564ZIS4_9BACT|nr:substrate-binding domain-containing protein [Candidatus Methylomirabilis lanthanidiphila]VUZ84542.1 ABC transporter substrate-binding protein [Candidatus Methylomirabilis lanthanidiphila]